MKQRWENGSFDRGALVLHEGSMDGGYWKGLSMWLLQLVPTKNLEHQGLGRKHNDLSRSDIL